jgi:hypothetical protein
MVTKVLDIAVKNTAGRVQKRIALRNVPTTNIFPAIKNGRDPLAVERTMSGKIPRPMGSIVLATALLLWGMSMGGTAGTAGAVDCLVAPNSPAPEGSHWYYHMDQANQRKCWYLRATDQPAQRTVAQRTFDTAAPTASTALENSATDPVSAPTSTKREDSIAVPSPRVMPQPALVSTATTAEPAQKSAEKRSHAPSTKPSTASASAPMPTASDDSTAQHLRGATVQSAPMRGATTDQSVWPSVQNGSAVSSITDTPAAQLRLSPQINDQNVATAPPASPAWPSPPTGVDKTQEPTAPPSDAQAEAVQPTKDAKATNDVEGAAQASTSTTNTGVAASHASTPVAIFPVVALGLVVAGFLLRIVVKVFIERRHRITVDHHDFDRINDPHPHQSANEQIDQHDRLTDYIQRSSRAVASKPGPRRLSQVDDERLNDAADTAPLRMDKINKYRPFGVDRFESERTDDKRYQRKWRNDEKRHTSPSIDFRESDRIDGQRQQGCRDQQHQHGSVGAGDELIDDLQSSLTAAGSDSRFRLPVQDDSPNEGGSRNAPSRDEIKEREEDLEQLRRSLDRLLQSSNVA